MLRERLMVNNKEGAEDLVRTFFLTKSSAPHVLGLLAQEFVDGLNDDVVEGDAVEL